ncbi:hypothetical protein FZEAL_2485 [Fusarium zealandicum]|uniref:Uncharacterized protein n=1 Tax=Fusarium zealandicum TaxID=1053134 RepID=A0A8H4URC4_9HYPO|nr:hypothetical protein FZEAL_2485 [Fusarium zealandicum]
MQTFRLNFCGLSSQLTGRNCLRWGHIDLRSRFECLRRKDIGRDHSLAIYGNTQTKKHRRDNLPITSLSFPIMGIGHSLTACPTRSNIPLQESAFRRAGDDAKSLDQAEAGQLTRKDAIVFSSSF